MAGSMLEVTWEITIPHPGYFRVALDKDPTKFTEPPYTDDVACTIDLSTVPKGAHDNVLMDGIDAEATSAMVKIPDEPCDDCTLQVIQAMKDHGPPNCTYYHCAKLKILPKDGGTSGSGGSAGSAAGAGGSAGSAGSAGMGGTTGSAGSAGSAGAAGVAGMTAGGTGGGSAPVAGNTGAPAGGAVAPPAGGGGTAPPMMMQPVGAGGAPAPTTSSESDSGGCAVTRVAGKEAGAGWLAFGLALVAFARRRRIAPRRG
jgi:MYXO-CTERM domain-containing protein